MQRGWVNKLYLLPSRIFCSTLRLRVCTVYDGADSYHFRRDRESIQRLQPVLFTRFYGDFSKKKKNTNNTRSIYLYDTYGELLL